MDKPVANDGRQAALDFNRYNRDWFIDKFAQVLMFIGGISAIVFIIGIFVFITREGFEFLFECIWQEHLARLP